jgi:hypothetical protein
MALLAGLMASEMRVTRGGGIISEVVSEAKLVVEEISIAVGTALSGGPPHRSQRAALPHWAPASGDGVEAHVREGMLHTGRR